MNQKIYFCYHCGATKRQKPLFTLVKSAVIHHVFTCMPCRKEHYPDLKVHETIPAKKWIELL